MIPLNDKKWCIFESTGILGEHSGLWPFLWHLTERPDWFSDKIKSEHKLDSSKYSPCLIGVTTQIISWNSRWVLGKGQIKLKFLMKIDPHKIKNPKNSGISEFSKIMNFTTRNLCRQGDKFFL